MKENGNESEQERLFNKPRAKLFVDSSLMSNLIQFLKYFYNLTNWATCKKKIGLSQKFVQEIKNCTLQHAWEAIFFDWR